MGKIPTFSIFSFVLLAPGILILWTANSYPCEDSFEHPPYPIRKASLFVGGGRKGGWSIGPPHFPHLVPPSPQRHHFEEAFF